MIKLASILHEDGPVYAKKSKEISVEEAISLIRDNCKEAIDQALQSRFSYRGYKGDAPYYSIDPSTRERVSGTNLYNALVSILPSWKDYPSRQKSVVFTNDREAVSTYGSAYWLFPFDGAKIAYCEGPDCWYEFQYVNQRMKTPSAIDGMMNRYAILIAKAALANRQWERSGMTQLVLSKTFRHFNDRLYTLSNTHTFLKELNRMTPAILKYSKMLVVGGPTEHWTDGYGPFYFNMAHDILENFKGDWIKYFDDLLNPESNKMHLTTIPDINEVPQSREMWTDSKCILINYFKDIKSHYQKSPSVSGTFFPDQIPYLRKAVPD